MTTQSAYLYLDGIQRLAQEVHGDEKVYTGIRPYALHAGNVMSIVAYPYLLCEATKSNGKEPCFEFIVSINDWEQDQLEGPDIHKYPFDTHPKHTTIKYTRDSTGKNIVDTWQPEIEKEVNKIKKDFPAVTIRFVRNSSLQSHPLMRQAVLSTIQDYDKQRELLLQSTGRTGLMDTMRFSNALCPQCLDANTNTSITDDNLLHTTCEHCSHEDQRPYEECDFWLYHKQLFPPRLAIFDFQITISGADHYLEGDFQARKTLYEYIYKEKMPNIKMAFAPLLIAPDHQKMSKSRKNDFYIPLEEILPQIRHNYSDSLHLNNGKIV